MRDAFRAILLLALLPAGGCVFDFPFDDQCFAGDPCALVDGGTTSDPGAGNDDSTGGDADGGATADDGTDTGGDVPDVPDDPDRDGDGIENDQDACPDDYDPSQLDTDGDKTPDACDPCIFVGGKQPPCYGTAWTAEQLTGLWRGYAVSHAGIETPMGLDGLSIRLTATGTWAHDEAGAADHALSVDQGGLVHLSDLAAVDGHSLDALLVAASDRSVMIGNLFVSGDEPPGAYGKMIPPSLVVLVRQREGGDGAYPESVTPGGRPSTRGWTVRGWSQDAPGQITAVQGRVETTVASDAIALTQGELYGFELTQDQGPQPANDGAPIAAITGGSMTESADGFSMVVSTENGDLTLTGALSFDRGFAIAASAPEDGQRLVLLLSEERLDSDPDRRDAAWALFGAEPLASLRGLVPEPPTTGSMMSMQLHRAADLEVSAANHALSNVATIYDPRWLSLDQGSEESPVTYQPGEGFMMNPRVCIYPTPVGDVGLMTVCLRTGTSQFDGCKIDKPCWIPLGAAVRLEPSSFGAHDFDLDGKNAETPSEDEPCSAAAGDTCSCTLNPGQSGC